MTKKTIAEVPPLQEVVKHLTTQDVSELTSALQAELKHRIEAEKTEKERSLERIKMAPETLNKLLDSGSDECPGALQIQEEINSNVSCSAKTPLIDIIRNQEEIIRVLTDLVRSSL